MQTARSLVDGREYTAQQLAQFPDSDRQALRGQLVCMFCGQQAHYRRATRAGTNGRSRSACFYCLPHGEDCEITRVNGDPWDAEESDSTVGTWERRGQTLVVQILSEEPPADAVEDALAADPEEGQRSRSGGARTRQSSTVRRGPQRLLEQLVDWPSFRTSALPIRMPDPNQTEMPVHTAFVRFEDADPERHTEHWHGFWGVLPPLRYWSYGNAHYANFGIAQRSFRIAIHDRDIPAILERFRLSRIQELVGGHLLLFDIARISTTGRFTADVNSVNHIGFLRSES